MTDIAMIWQAGAFMADIAQAGGDLRTSDELASAVVVSLFTWRRANPDDKLPDQTGLEGWWGDTFAANFNDKIGSRLWLLRREKLTQETANRAREYMAEALQWLVVDGVATAVDIEMERLGHDRLDTAITIHRKSGTETLRFENVWEALQNA